jgi:hypothetical protein
LPEHLFAGRSALGRIILANERPWVPSFSVSVTAARRSRTKKHWQWTAASFGVPPWRPAAAQWLKLPDRKLRRINTEQPPGIFDGSVYFPYIPARSTLAADLNLRFDRRGLYQQDSFNLSTRFPFAFLAKTRRISMAREILVYPPVEPTDEFFEILPLITGEFETFVRGRGNDLYRIREYLPEDSARHVDWKATAKSGSLKVREFSREDGRKLKIVFDQPGKGEVSNESYESAIALAASLSWHFSKENTDISFMAQGYAGAPDVYSFLRYLALANPGTTEASLIEEIQPSDDYNIILTSRPKGSLPTGLWACSYFIFIEK